MHYLVKTTSKVLKRQNFLDQKSHFQMQYLVKTTNKVLKRQNFLNQKLHLQMQYLVKTITKVLKNTNKYRVVEMIIGDIVKILCLS